MYKVRLWSTRHSGAMERIYKLTRPAVILGLKLTHKVFGTRLDGVFTSLEAGVKGFFFDCKMCGDCALSKTGMTCPMNCPKTIRNGPCGGVRADGHCEVKPEMKCVWVQAWEGSKNMQDGVEIHKIEFAVDQRNKGSSSWLRLARDE